MKAVVLAGALVLLGVGAYFIFKQETPVTSTQESAKTESDAASPDDAANITATITYTDSGFTPALTKVTSEDTLKIVNRSSGLLQMDSDPHPEHTDDEELNVGTVAPGKSRTFVLTTKGTWGFHNHLDASNTARVDVE